MRIAITGAWGNLGWKLIRHLTSNGLSEVVYGLDIRSPSAVQLQEFRSSDDAELETRIRCVECDLTDFDDSRWRRVIESVDTVVHFAARNPFPDATWSEALASLDMTLYLAEAAASSKTVKRFVFASSNHVMGRYKDPPLSDSIAPGGLHTELEPAPGTQYNFRGRPIDATPYATAKLIGEQVCRFQARQTQGDTTYVCVRIGWCQPGANRPETITPSGSPTFDLDSSESADELERNQKWFSRMWLSNRDYLQLFEKAMVTPGTDWPDGFILVNGMSDNAGMAWDLTATRKWLNYVPEDGISH